MDLEIFKKGNWKVRSIEKDGESWFVAKDVAHHLGYSDTNQAIRAHCKKAKSCPVNLTGQVRNIKLIQEPDVYRLIFKSTLPEAEKFEKWVMEEVLPSIRKTGSYSVKDMNEEYKLAFGCGEAAGYFGKERYYLAHKIMEKHGSKMPEKYHEDLDYHLEGSTVVNDFIETKKIKKGKGYSRDEMFKEFKEYIFERFGASFSTFKGTLKSLGIDYVNTRKKKFFIKK